MYIFRREKGVEIKEKRVARMFRNYDEAWNCSSNLPFEARDINYMDTFRRFKSARISRRIIYKTLTM